MVAAGPERALNGALRFTARGVCATKAAAGRRVSATQTEPETLDIMNLDHITISRREFLAKAALASAAVSLGPGPSRAAAPGAAWPPALAVFSKVYQTLKLSFEEAADVTAAAGLDGVDCPVRPGGEILPQRAADELPRYQEALRRRGVRLLLLTTAVTSPATPHAPTLLRTARDLGLRYYRLGWWSYEGDRLPDTLLRDIRAQLKDLAGLNRELGLCALVQNHSPGGRKYAGGDLAELYQMLREVDPAQVGVAFDIGHALIVHGDRWTEHFERLAPYIKVAYVKDPDPAGKFVPFGQGRVGQTDFFKRLKALGYSAPISVHIEFEWLAKDEAHPRAALVQALLASRRTVQAWLSAA